MPNGDSRAWQELLCWLCREAKMLIDDETRKWAQPWKTDVELLTTKAEPYVARSHAHDCTCPACKPGDWKMRPDGSGLDYIG